VNAEGEGALFFAVVVDLDTSLCTFQTVEVSLPTKFALLQIPEQVHPSLSGPRYASLRLQISTVSAEDIDLADPVCTR
jgi:hypothetical protein